MDMIMEYAEFQTEILDLVQRKLTDEHKIAVKPVKKNNGIVLHGLVINNNLSNISPTIYLDYYFEDYKNGESVYKLAEKIVAQYKKFEIDEDFDISTFTDWEKAKPSICYKLINRQKNEDILKEIPHIDYLDLTIVFYALVSNKPFESSSILIRNNHMSHWGVGVDELYEIASENTPKLLEYELRNLASVVQELVSKNADEEMMAIAEGEFQDEESAMFVLTNKIKLNGASTILYKKVLENFAEQLNCDLYIIPSSIHEVLLIPNKTDLDTDYLNALVKEVNAADLSPEEVLSDHLYYYSRKDQALLAS